MSYEIPGFLPNMAEISDATDYNLGQLDILTSRWNDQQQTKPDLTHRHITSDIVQLRMGMSMPELDDFGLLGAVDDPYTVIIEDILLESIAADLVYRQEFADGEDLFYLGDFEDSGLPLWVMTSCYGAPRSKNLSMPTDQYKIALATYAGAGALELPNINRQSKFSELHPELTLGRIASMRNMQLYAYENLNPRRDPATIEKLTVKPTIR